MEGSDLGRALRVRRERRGWARETLAHHSGVSWAAITQIETGRRPDPRLSTVIALANALDITVDQLTGRAGRLHARVGRLEHHALLYADDTDFVDASLPWLAAGLERSEAVLVVTTPGHITRLRRALGPGAGGISFSKSSDWYSSPSAALGAFRAFLDRSIGQGSPWVRILGEPVWAARSAAEVRAWVRYESMLNMSFAGSPATIVCPYNTTSLPARIVADARCTHPVVTTGAEAEASQRYREPELLLLER